MLSQILITIIILTILLLWQKRNNEWIEWINPEWIHRDYMITSKTIVVPQEVNKHLEREIAKSSNGEK